MPILGRAGKNSRIIVAGATLNLNEYSADERADDLDLTNFESGGVEEGTDGIHVVEFSVKGSWDGGRNPYGDPPGIYPRDNLAGVFLYINVADNVKWSLPKVRILSARNSSAVRQLVNFEASGKSNGPYTRPA